MSIRVGVNYLQAGNALGDSDANLDRDFAFFKAHKLTVVDIRLNMTAFFSDTSTVIIESAIANAKRYRAAARRAGIKPIWTFWTQPPHDESSGNKFYPAWVGKFSNLHANATVKAAWLAWVDRMVQELDDDETFGWNICNEPYGTNQQSIGDWLIATAQKIRAKSIHEISCHFILGWNPYTSAYSNWRRVMAYLTRMGVTIYNNPDSDAYNTASRGTWATLSTVVMLAAADGKPTDIIEFGNSSSNDETQRVHYEHSLVNRFIPLGIDSAIAWAWQSRSPSNESYNISRGVAVARPAFYELEKVADGVTPPPPVTKYTLTIAQNTGGSTNPTGSTQYDAGASVTVTASPDSTHLFDYWMVDGSQASANPLTLVMNQPHTVQPYFKAKPPPPVTYYMLTITQGVGGFTQPEGAVQYLAGDQVTVTAHPDDLHDFGHWVLNGQSLSANPLFLVMNTDANLRPVFILKPPVKYVLTISGGDGGTSTPSGSLSFNAGASVTVTAHPDGLHEFDHWLVDGAESAANPLTVVMDGDKDVQVFFKDGTTPPDNTLLGLMVLGAGIVVMSKR